METTISPGLRYRNEPLRGVARGAQPRLCLFSDVLLVVSMGRMTSVETLFCSCFWSDRDSGGQAWIGGGGLCASWGARCEQKEVWPSPRAHLLPYWSLLFSSDPSLFLFYPQCPSSVGRFSTQLPLVQKEVPFSCVC